MGPRRAERMADGLRLLRGESETAGRGSQGAGHHDPIAWLRPRPQDGASWGDLAHDAHGDRDAVRARRVAADQAQGVLAGGLAHPSVQLDGPWRVDGGRQAQRDQAEPGASGHRGHVAHVDGDRLVAEVPRRHTRRVEVDALDQHVHREDQDPLTHPDHRAVIARTDQDLGGAVADDAPKREHEVVLTDPSVPFLSRSHVAGHRSSASDRERIGARFRWPLRPGRRGRRPARPGSASLRRPCGRAFAWRARVLAVRARSA